MANLDKTESICYFDMESHFCGEICWCKPDYNEDENAFYHNIKFDKGKTAPAGDTIQ